MKIKYVSEVSGVPYWKVRQVITYSAQDICTDSELEKIAHVFEIKAKLIRNLRKVKK